MSRAEDRIRCDGFGCTESHPIDHPTVGKDGFGLGRWVGWVYLDLNRTDLFDRPLRFCTIACMTDWCEFATRRSHLTPQRHPFDDLLARTPVDEVDQQRRLTEVRKRLTREA